MTASEHDVPARPVEDPSTATSSVAASPGAAEQQTITTQRAIQTMVTGADIRLKALQAFADLGLPLILDGGYLSSDEITDICVADPALMRRFLHAMHAYGVLTVDDQGRYGLTLLGHGLAPGQGSIWAALGVTTSPLWQQAGNSLAHTIRAGFPDVLGGEATPYPLVARDPALGPMFDLFMSGRAAGLATAMAARDYSEVRTVADLGGGIGSVLATILTAQPHLQGILVERPDVAARAERYIAEQELTDRVRITQNDIFSGVCPTADRIIVSSVLHNWDDATNIMLLCGIRDALDDAGPDARLWCVETLLPEPGTYTSGTDLDLRIMSLFADGQERSLSQYSALMKHAGLTLLGFEPLPGDHTLMVAGSDG